MTASSGNQDATAEASGSDELDRDLGTCSSYGSWGTRPVPVGGVGPHGIQVLVVYRLATVTPILGLVTSSTGTDLYIRTTVTGNELYF